MDVLDSLRETYESELGKGPFPTSECAIAKLTDPEHGILTIFLADVAGIASHGRELESITEARKAEFRKITSRSFEEQWPNTNAKITLEGTPKLFRLMKETEKARLLIVRYLAGESVQKR